MSQNIAVVSGRFPASTFHSHINHKLYCSKHGYTYVNCNWPTGQRIGYLNKIEYILEYIDYFDYIFWIDDDAFFVDQSKPLSEFMPQGDEFISLCKSPSFKSLKTMFSSGQFLLKCNADSKTFMQSILRINIEDVRKWWTDDLGFFTGGDQDIMVYLYKNQYESKFRLWDYKYFNSRIENVLGTDEHDVFLLHFTGKEKVKASNCKKAQRELNLTKALVSKEEFDEIVPPGNVKKTVIKRLQKIWQ